MSKCYDIDHSGEDAKRALRAIVARIKGAFDHPDLAIFGPLSGIEDDILRIAESVNLDDED